MHLKPFTIDDPGFKCEMTIDDLLLFPDGKLSHIERMWTAVKKYSLMVDHTHSQTIRAITDHLNKISGKVPRSEEDLDDAVLAEMELEALSDSDSYLVKSLIFLNLLSFVEHARKEIYKLVHPTGPPFPSKCSVGFVIKALTEKEILDPQEPASYVEHFSRHIDPVRNNFAHGDWKLLSQTLHALDLTQSFIAVAEYLSAAKERLKAKHYDV